MTQSEKILGKEFFPLNFYLNNRFYILSEDVDNLLDKKEFKERRVRIIKGNGEKREELDPLYYNLSDSNR